MTPRVLVLTTYFRPILGGVETTAEQLSKYLAANGCGVRVLTKRVTRGLPAIEERDGIVIERIGPLGDRSAAGKWCLVAPAAAWLVRQRSSYDVVCCIDYRGIGVAAIAARALTRKRVVLQAQTPGVLAGRPIDAAGSRGLEPEGWLTRAAKWPARVIYRRADAIACIGREIEREALASGVPRDRVHYLPNAVDTARFHPATKDQRETLRLQFGVPAGELVCLFVGRLSREKGLMDLLEAWRLAQPARAMLLVAGPDMDAHPWNVGPAGRAFVERHGLSASVRFLGSISDPAPLLRTADVVIQPSHFEALGLSAVESLASGVPVVASAVGGLLDFIVDGNNGLLSPPQDPRALASRRRTILDDAALRARLAARARASVVAEYDERVVFGRFAQLLRRLAGGAA